MSTIDKWIVLNYHWRMKLKKLIPYLTICLIAAASLVFYFTRASIVFVYSPLIADEYIKNLSKPPRISLRYRTSYKKEGEEIKDADLVVVLPPAIVESENAIYIKVGNGRRFLFDEFSLLEKALIGKSYSGIAILYNSMDEAETDLAVALKEKYDNLELIEYEDRVSLINIDSIKEEAQNLKIREILIPTPSNAMTFIEDTDIKIYMDFINAATFSGCRNIISIKPDWNKAIGDALRSDGDIPFSYAFSTT